MPTREDLPHRSKVRGVAVDKVAPKANPRSDMNSRRRTEFNHRSPNPTTAVHPSSALSTIDHVRQGRCRQALPSGPLCISLSAMPHSFNIHLTGVVIPEA